MWRWRVTVAAQIVICFGLDGDELVARDARVRGSRSADCTNKGDKQQQARIAKTKGRTRGRKGVGVLWTSSPGRLPTSPWKSSLVGYCQVCRLRNAHAIECRIRKRRDLEQRVTAPDTNEPITEWDQAIRSSFRSGRVETPQNHPLWLAIPLVNREKKKTTYALRPWNVLVALAIFRTGHLRQGRHGFWTSGWAGPIAQTRRSIHASDPPTPAKNPSTTSCPPQTKHSKYGVPSTE